MKKISMEVLNVQMVDINKVVANDYNPNKVAKPEMKLLERSIIENDKYVIVDGFHRYTVSLKLELEEVPVVVLKHDIKKRVAATIQFNRARGTHQIPDMAKIVLSLFEKGWNDYEISEHLGMDLDEVIRLKQMNGLKEAFANHIFSKSWEEFEKNNITEKE